MLKWMCGGRELPPPGVNPATLFNNLGEVPMVSRKEWYVRANSAWPADVPDLTADEAIRATRKLYRFVRKRRLEHHIRITSGNRYTRPIGFNVLQVNPAPGNPSTDYKRHGGGWQALVHDLSHWLDPGRGHSKGHARLERRMIHEVVRRGWLAGKLKSETKPPRPEEDPKVARQKSIAARIARWAAKKKRADRALQKLVRQQKYYERVAAQ